MQHACALVSSVTRHDLLYFPHDVINGTNFGGKKIIEHKCVFRFLLKLLSETFLVLRRTERDMITNIRGGADKSLARSTSRYRGTESIVSLERGVCSCAELQVFSCCRG